MKILVINWQCIKNPLGGGAEVHMHEIFKRITAKGHEVVNFACEIPGESKEEFIDGVKIIRNGARNTFNFGVKGYYQKNLKNKFDIIIDNINKIPFYTPLFVKEPLMAISHHFFGRSIFRESNFVAGTYVYIAEKFIDYVYKNTPFAVVSKSTLDEFLTRGFPKENFTIVPNAITPSEFPMTISKKYENPTITYFGRVKKYKSVDHLVLAFEKVQKEIPEARLEIMGRGDFEDYLKELCKKLNIYKKVKFHGFVSNEKKVDVLSKSHLVVNTSIKEGWGITNIEANACGTPVISANSPGLRDSVNDGESGKLYKYGDINELSSILIEILKNNKKRKHLEEGALKWANKFNWDNSADLMLDLIKRTIKDFQK